MLLWVRISSQKGGESIVGITYKTCIYSSGESQISDKINIENYADIGFDIKLIDGEYHNIFSHLSKYKVDIVIIDATSFNKDDLSYVIDIIYQNFCKNVVLVSNDEIDNENVDNILFKDTNSFDLILLEELLNCKRKIEQNPHCNSLLIKRKVSEILIQMMFSSKHDGFKYYLEATTIAYLNYPYDYSTMELYKEVAIKYGKTICAVEKSMRSALLSAFNRVKNSALTAENAKIKSTFTYNINNNMAIGMIVSKLLMDQNLTQDAKLMCF